MLNTAFNQIISFFIKNFFISDIKNGENIVFNKPVILVANHSSYLDHFFLLYLFKRYNKTYDLYFLTKEEAFEKFLSRKWHEIMKSVSVSRETEGFRGLNSLKKIIIENNKSVVIYPEGTRSNTGKMSEGKMGAVLLSLKTGAPIIPIGLEGTFDVLPKTKRLPYRNKIQIRIGKPIYVKSKNKSDLLNQHHKIMRQLDDLSNAGFERDSQSLIEVAREYNELGISNYPNKSISPENYHRRAIHISKSLIKKNESLAESYYELARAQGRLGIQSKIIIYRHIMLYKAKKNSLKALEIKPRYSDAYYVLGTYFLWTSSLMKWKKKLTESYYRKAQEIQPGSIYINVALGKLFISEKNFEEARIFFIKAIASKAVDRKDIRRQLEARSILMRIDENY
ncbi:1-acyl-sn-glycerol-3-phosphate acyltransferase [Carnobacterium maltaromaticum]|uniref:1-acyl-sn-glycerol-3-phosphate acyltransferase n=1 Tax=Carnobacterium maltaromaticum TaxID=2751 RepID=UPI00295E3A55|nr:1-acyl-sn-glycerol-3-phosphate acyltransferase [Carnobacterium maltaromaticum]